MPQVDRHARGAATATAAVDSRRPRRPPRRRRVVPDRRRSALHIRLPRPGHRRAPGPLRRRSSRRSSLRQLDENSDWWLLALELPHASRLEYKLEVSDSFGTRLVEDPLNGLAASHPFGANSVCEAAGHATPEWSIARDDVPTGSIHDVSSHSAALAGRRRRRSTCPPDMLPTRAAIPARHRPRRPRLPALRRRHRPLSTTSSTAVSCHRRWSPSCTPVNASSSMRTTSATTTTSSTSCSRNSKASCPQAANRRSAASSAPASGPSRHCRPQCTRLARSVACCCNRVRSPAPARGAGRVPSRCGGPVKQFVRRFLDRPFSRSPSCLRHLWRLRVVDLREPRPRSGVASDGDGVRFDESLDGHNWESWRDSLGSGAAGAAHRRA